MGVSSFRWVLRRVGLLGVLWVLVSAGRVSAVPPIATPDGYATQNGGTTGGGDATPVRVTTAEQFRDAIKGDAPAVIIVDGRIDLGTSVRVGSNKTIVGATADAGFHNGSIGLHGRNYIIQNLTFGPSRGDLLEVSGASNAFIHKCEFVDSTDESLSVVREADFVTISWCKFHFTRAHSHAFGNLIGNSSGRVSDRGKLHVTMHHNWYGANVRGRMPRVRFGTIHIYNNYYNSPDSGYIIGVGIESRIRVEHTHFDGVKEPWKSFDTTHGEIGWSDLKLENSPEPTWATNAFPLFDPPYEFTADPVEQVKQIVTAGAGNVHPD